MGRLLRVGLTGGIGSGKSTVARLLAMLGAAVYVADDRAKALMLSDPGLRAGIVERFGPEAYRDDGGLDRAQIARQAFGHPERLAALNALVHPAVERDFHRWVSEQERERPRPTYAVEEAAVLIESGGWQAMDRIVVVTAPLSLRVERVVRRDGMSREEAMSRIRAQMDDDERAAYADTIIVADDARLLIPQVAELHGTLCRAARSL